MVARQLDDRIERRDQDESCEATVAGEIGGHGAADADTDRHDRPGLQFPFEMIENGQRVREQRLTARSPAARAIAAIMEYDDLTLREELMQGQGHGLGVPGVAGKPEQDRGALSADACGRQAHAGQADSIGSNNLEADGRRRQFRAPDRSQLRRKDQPRLREIHRGHEGEIGASKGEDEIDEPAHCGLPASSSKDQAP